MSRDDRSESGTQHADVPDAAFEAGAEQLAVAARDDRHLEAEGCPECDQRPTEGIESFSLLFSLYSPAEPEGLARCRNCQTVFDVDSGEVIDS
ncbi:hypothetical protein [Halobaculum sp. EA56]|uniref:hypothetical protein n=1 Tax=Halobaculum sp. EA56 TaxID=3421648 RepID=UPI003EB8633A